jgi:proline iminopeptidase
VATACASPDDDASPSGVGRFEELYVTTPDGVRLYVRVTGQGPDTVVVPGAAWLARDLGPLAARHTLIFFDPRGRGASDALDDLTRLGIEYQVRDIDVIRNHFGLERISLIGWSYLGAVVALYAADHPDRVTRVVQVGPMPPTTELAAIADQRGSPPDSADRAFVTDLERSGEADRDPVGFCREYMMRIMIRPMMGRPEAASTARIDPCLYWNEWPSQLTRTIPHVIPAQWDYRDRATRVTAPVLTIHGTDDPNAAVEGGRAWVDLLPNARLVELEGVGHAPWLEAPELFFAEVDAFLRADRGP